MAANKILNIEPVFVPAIAGNLLNCGITSLAGPIGYTQTQPYIVLQHIRVTNNDIVAHTVALYKGLSNGSAPGTEFAFSGATIQPKASLDWVGRARFDSADFLTGVADTASKVTFTAEGEIGLA